MFEQDPISGGFLIDPNYSMWTPGAPAVNKPALWANDRMWQHERRFAQVFSTSNDQAMWTLRFRFGVRRSLPPNWCYGYYSEVATGGATLLLQSWLRTLVSDEGA